MHSHVHKFELLFNEKIDKKPQNVAKEISQPRTKRIERIERIENTRYKIQRLRTERANHKQAQGATM
jgi:hypothetical protein